MKDILIILLCFISIGIGLGISECRHSNDKDIGAMEVYKGNTILQYTVIDSVKVDSCVIFFK